MYSKKYRLDKVEEFNAHNLMYEGIEGSLCYLAYLHVGERGWFLYHRGDVFRNDIPHRVHTTIVEDVEYTDNQVIVTTLNTRFTFTAITEVN